MERIKNKIINEYVTQHFELENFRILHNSNLALFLIDKKGQTIEFDNIFENIKIYINGNYYMTVKKYNNRTRNKIEFIII